MSGESEKIRREYERLHRLRIRGWLRDLVGATDPPRGVVDWGHRLFITETLLAGDFGEKDSEAVFGLESVRFIARKYSVLPAYGELTRTLSEWDFERVMTAPNVDVPDDPESEGETS